MFNVDASNTSTIGGISNSVYNTSDDEVGESRRYYDMIVSLISYRST